MGCMATRFRRSARLFLALTAVLALTLAACGGDDGDSDDTSTDTTTADTADDGPDVGTGNGVTADTVKVGIVMVDYDAIADFVDFARGDQEETAQIFVDWINENGGVAGRQIEPVFLPYKPVPGQEPSALTLCTTLTEDEQVFAVLGVYVDFTGDAQLCVTRDHETIHVGHELEQPWFDAAPPGLLLSSESVLEKDAANLVSIMNEEGLLEGSTVGVLGDTDGEARVEDVIVPALEDSDAELGTVGITTIDSTDTSASNAQIQGFIERWNEEGVDTLFISGLRASAIAHVSEIKAAMPDVQLIVDAASVVEQGRDAEASGTDPNPYEGMYSILGATDSEQFENNETFHECIEVYEEATGETVLGPDEVEPGPDGKTQQIYIAVRDFCGELLMFKQIADAAGDDLSNETWVEAVSNFGALDMPNSESSSICDGKFAAVDSFRVVQFDPSIGENGEWAEVTELVDTSEGACG